MSTKDLAGFCMDLQDFGAVIMPNDHSRFCKALALKVLQGVIEKTPVDTGLAKGNWQVTEGTPPSAPVETMDKIGGETLAKGQGVIMAATPMRNIIWIANNLPYAEPLENGHSKRAPAGMVMVTLLEVQNEAFLL